MKDRVGPHTIAGWLYVIPALFVIGIWYLYLFVALPEDQAAWDSAAGQLRYAFSDANPMAWWFAWLGAFPVLCLLLAAAYLSNAARTRASRLALFAAAIALAGATFAINDWGIAILVTLPIIWGYRAILTGRGDR